MKLPNFESSLSWPEQQNNEELHQFLTKEVLPDLLYECRWFGGKSFKIQQVQVQNSLHLQHGYRHYYLLVLEVYYKESYAHSYFLPLAVVKESQDWPRSAFLAEAKFGNEAYQLVDAVYDTGFHHCLYEHLHRGETLSYESDHVFFRAFNELDINKTFQSQLLNAEQSNSTIVINDQYFLKIFRRLFRDKNPDFEMNEFLSQQSQFKNSPKLAGLIWWEPRPGYDISLGLMQKKVANEGEAWSWMLQELEAFFKQAQNQPPPPEKAFSTLRPQSLKKLAPQLLENPGKAFFIKLQNLARRTAEMHIALARNRRDRAFAPVPYNSDFTVWLKNRLIYQFDARYNLLNKKLDQLPEEARALGIEVLKRKDQIINFILGFDEEHLQSERIRIHGDFHLGQILIQDDDFYILDFEGEPESTIRDRKVKQSPLKDVSGLLRSLHYAIFATLKKEQDSPSKEELNHGHQLYDAMSGVFLKTYLKLAFEEQLDIGYRKEIHYLLRYFLLEKAIYELGYELNGRPDWAIIPLRGIIEITDEIKKYESA